MESLTNSSHCTDELTEARKNKWQRRLKEELGWWLHRGSGERLPSLPDPPRPVLWGQAPSFSQLDPGPISPQVQISYHSSRDSSPLAYAVLYLTCVGKSGASAKGRVKVVPGWINTSGANGEPELRPRHLCLSCGAQETWIPSLYHPQKHTADGFAV